MLRTFLTTIFMPTMMMMKTTMTMITMIATKVIKEITCQQTGPLKREVVEDKHLFRMNLG